MEDVCPLCSCCPSSSAFPCPSTHRVPSLCVLPSLTETGSFPALPSGSRTCRSGGIGEINNEKKWYYSIVPQGPSAAHQCWWGTEMGCVPVCCAQAPQAIQEVRRSSFWFSSVHLFCLCSHLGLRFLFRCLPQNSRASLIWWHCPSALPITLTLSTGIDLRN